MQHNRNISIRLVFDVEKGYVNRPETDNGGPTNRGVTLATLSAWRGRPCTIDELKRLTEAEAYEIYEKNYWQQIAGDEMPSGLDFALFDSCVTSGAKRTIILLQDTLRAAGITNSDGSPLKSDGILGLNTKRGIYSYPGGVKKLIRDFCDVRLAWMRTLAGPKGFKSNGRGWTIRVTGIDPKHEWPPISGVVGNALKLADESASSAVVPTPQVVGEAIAAKAAASVGAKTIDLIPAVTTLIGKAEALTGSAAAIAAVITAISGSQILSYATAVVVLIAGYYFVQRIRHMSN